MSQSQSQTHGPQWPVIDYSAEIAKALEWLGDRYLLATPTRHARNHSRVARLGTFGVAGSR